MSSVDDFSGIRLIHKGRRPLRRASALVVGSSEDFMFWSEGVCVFVSQPVELL